MHAKDKDGNLECWLDCPVCGWRGIIYYTRKKPVYCCDACKAKAYRERKRDNSQIESVTLLLNRRQNNVIKTVFIEHQAAKYLAAGKREIAYAIYILGRDINAPASWSGIEHQARKLNNN